MLLLLNKFITTSGIIIIIDQEKMAKEKTGNTNRKRYCNLSCDNKTSAIFKGWVMMFFAISLTLLPSHA